MRTLRSTLAVCFLICTLAACATSTPNTVAKQYVTAIYAGDVETAYTLFYFPETTTAESGLERTVHDKLQAMANKAKHTAAAQGGVATISTGKPMYDDTYSDGKKRAKVPVTIQFNNGESTKTTVTLKSTKKGWLLYVHLI